jgi:uncharacterized protein YggE
MLTGALAIALLLGAAGCATQSAAADDGSSSGGGRTIVGTATGRVEGIPDTLTVTLGVESHAGSAQAALAQNSERATRVIAALKAAGVAAADLQTTQLALNPTFDQKGRPNGYGVSNVVTARIEDTSRLVATARADAVHRARQQAGQLARAADVRLGPVERITERRPASPKYFAAQARIAGDVATSAPIEPGSQELTVDVTVVFGIR